MVSFLQDKRGDRIVKLYYINLIKSNNGQLCFEAKSRVIFEFNIFKVKQNYNVSIGFGKVCRLIILRFRPQTLIEMGAREHISQLGARVCTL